MAPEKINVPTLTRREFVRTAGKAAAAGMLAGTAAPLRSLGQGRPSRPNVLFIMVDDLRPDLGCYGNPHIKSPHIDSLAARGIVFNRAYCQQAICNPSRASLLTGRRPDTIKVHDQTVHFRNFTRDIVTLPQYFKNKGYRTRGVGKIFHPGLDDPRSWTRPQPELKSGAMYPNPKTQQRIRRQTLAAKSLGRPTSWIESVLLGPAFEAYDAPDSEFLDGALCDEALSLLTSMKNNQPFFLAVGFFKPHLPFVAPKKYWDLYDPEALPLAGNPYIPEGAPPYAINDMYELSCYEGFAGVPQPCEGSLPEDLARKLKHGYYACVSFVDAQIGRLLEALDRFGLRNNTIVILIGDHGWKLGEHRSWGKQTNYEIDTRSPLIMADPRGGLARGRDSSALVEFVDIYPTLCEMAGLTIPQGLEGYSMAALMGEPDLSWKSAVFSQFPRGFMGKIMGKSVRTDRYRYVEWRDWIDNTYLSCEVYDHRTDPEENINIALRPENQPLCEELARILWAGWWEALPQR